MLPVTRDRIVLTRNELYFPFDHFAPAIQKSILSKVSVDAFRRFSVTCKHMRRKLSLSPTFCFNLETERADINSLDYANWMFDNGSTSLYAWKLATGKTEHLTIKWLYIFIDLNQELRDMLVALRGSVRVENICFIKCDITSTAHVLDVISALEIEGLKWEKDNPSRLDLLLQRPIQELKWIELEKQQFSMNILAQITASTITLRKTRVPAVIVREFLQQWIKHEREVTSFEVEVQNFEDLLVILCKDFPAINTDVPDQADDDDERDDNMVYTVNRECGPGSSGSATLTIYSQTYRRDWFTRKVCFKPDI